MIQKRTLTISGYEKRLIKVYREIYEAGIRRGILLSYFWKEWELDDVGVTRVKTAIKRLCRRGIILRRQVKGKIARGAYIYNPNYKPKSQK